MRQLEVPASCSLDDLIPVERPDPGEPGAGQVLVRMRAVSLNFAIDIGGASSLNESVRATAVGGAVGIVGLVGGLMATINLAEIFQRNLRLDGIETGSREMLEAIVPGLNKRASCRSSTAFSHSRRAAQL